jgi:hypothetical protein
MSQTSTPVHSTRQAERRSIRLPIRLLGVRDAVIHGHTLNLSASGALIVVPVSLPLGNLIEVELDLPDGGAPVSVTAMAVRQATDRPIGRARHVGLTFLMPSRTFVSRVRALVFENDEATDVL